MPRQRSGPVSSELGPLLGRWHQWRLQYSHERGFVRSPCPPADVTADTEEQLEQLTMLTIERTVQNLPRHLQLALQHIARAECMGVEVFADRDMFDDVDRESLIALAMAELHDRLRLQGVV